jgi:pimeloyl-ACP methyl ester carboxylesterase
MMTQNQFPPLQWFQWSLEANDYLIDSAQRSVLFWDVLRRRGNNYLKHLRRGQPPVLVFDYETVLDGHSLARPVNYALVRITDRRYRQPDSSGKVPSAAGTERRHRSQVAAEAPKAVSRPIVIIDPRAGHGPGIGGAKQDSQIGMALDAGHPVYFMIFSTRPVKGQSLADVRDAQIRFVETVRSRHPDAPKPAVIGNCQGGWAAALIGAERPDLVGPMVFNGSPLSYWGGVQGTSSLRYRGGLMGGAWLASLISDIGNGEFDGVHLVANFEDLNPANTLWGKQYHLFANIDTEESRYLDFERWWGGFFRMSAGEIHTIVDSLFVGNKLERGEFELEAGKIVDLRNNNNPVVVFASFGDNITPPPQAFNWILRVYGTVDEIRRRGQVIVVHRHDSIGHLGIFVSAKIARKEHREIIASFDMLDYLPPGLYEMMIEADPDQPGEYQVRYLERTTEEMLAADEGEEDERAFHAVRAVSRFNDHLYRTTAAPWVRLMASEFSSELMRQLHVLRMQRYLISDLNPWLMPVKFWASMIRKRGLRKPAPEDNAYRRLEGLVSQSVMSGLEFWREVRDRGSENLFRAIYESPWMKVLYPPSLPDSQAMASLLEELRRMDANHWRNVMDKGGFPEAVVRMILALMLADGELARKGYQTAERLIRSNDRLRSIGPELLREIVRDQARILQTDTDQALEVLPELLSSRKDRDEALALFREAVEMAEIHLKPQEQRIVAKIIGLLES